jgi:hypothetical protein
LECTGRVIIIIIIIIMFWEGEFKYLRVNRREVEEGEDLEIDGWEMWRKIYRKWSLKMATESTR